MSSKLRDELISLNALRRIYQNRGIPKEAAVKLAIHTLASLKEKASHEKKAFLGDLYAKSPELVGLGLGGLAGAGVGAGLEYMRRPEEWEPEKSWKDYLRSALWGGAVGGGLGGLYGLTEGRLLEESEAQKAEQAKALAEEAETERKARMVGGTGVVPAGASMLHNFYRLGGSAVAKEVAENAAKKGLWQATKQIGRGALTGTKTLAGKLALPLGLALDAPEAFYELRAALNSPSFLKGLEAERDKTWFMNLWTTPIYRGGQALQAMGAID